MSMKDIGVNAEGKLYPKNLEESPQKENDAVEKENSRLQAKDVESFLFHLGKMMYFQTKSKMND